MVEVFRLVAFANLGLVVGLIVDLFCPSALMRRTSGILGVAEAALLPAVRASGASVRK
jgi:hypothetical protein